MNPNINLREQEAIERAIGADSRLSHGEINRQHGRLRDLRRELSHWMMLGGFAPDWLAYPYASCWYLPELRADQPEIAAKLEGRS